MDPRFRNFRVPSRLTLADNPLRSTDERGLSIEYAMQPVANVVFLCLYADGDGAMAYREDDPDGTMPPPLWQGSRRVGPRLLDRLLGVLDRNGVRTMEHHYPPEVLDGDCFHLLARLKRGEALRHVYIDTPQGRESPSARRVYDALKPLVWYTEEEFVLRSAAASPWIERFRGWFTW